MAIALAPAGTWSAVLPEPLARQAITIADEVGSRMTDPERVAECAALAARQTSFPGTVRWRPHDVGQGEAGLALLFGQLARCSGDSAWENAAHAYLRSAARGAQDANHLQPGLFSGLAGVAFAADLLSRNGTRYQRLLAELDRWLTADALDRGAALANRPWRGGSVGRFDAISGLAGTAAYLLGRPDSPALRAVLTGLVAVCGERDGLPNWHTPGYALTEDQRQRYPHGNLNCGLAHGIPGPLAVLATALAQGAEVPGLADAVRRVADWLTANRADDSYGINWPYAVALQAPADRCPSRSAWCYGSPGVARALWLAGNALGDDALCELAVEAMLAVFDRPRPARGIDSPGFCHGVAGLLQITARFANDTKDPRLRTATVDLTAQLIAQFAPERPLGYYSLEPGGVRVDQPGLLDGAPGVALALLAAATDVPPEWDRLFLLS